MSSYPSKTRKVKCFYCNQEMLEENLKPHCELKHRAPKRVAGQQDILSLFAGSAKKAKTISVPKASSELLLQTGGSGGRETPDYNILSRPETPTENPEDQIEQPKDNDKINELVGIVKNIDMNSENTLHEVKLLKDSIKTLESSLKKKVPEFAKPDDVAPSDSRIAELTKCKTVEDILETFPELVFEEDTNKILCELCFIDKEAEGSRIPGQFDVNIEEEDLDNSKEGEDKRKQVFYNLKKSLKRHFENTLHTENWEAWNKKNEEEKAFKKRNYEVGMRIARICYVDYKEGNSKRHFEKEILKADMNGCDMGDLNHSDQFPRKFRPFVKDEINGKLKTFFNSLNIAADKGTNVHRSRQFTTAKTCIPNSPNLISSIYLGQPVVKEHDGPGVTKHIVEEIDKFKIKSAQIEGCSFDGAYFHQSVPTHLKKDKNLPNQFLSTHDPLHKSGIVDAHIRNDPSFSWLTHVQDICSEIYNKFNWGKNHELLIDTCKQLNLTLASLTKFSKTRFANSIRNVTINIRKDFEVIVECLKKLTIGKDSHASKIREKAQEAERILQKICNKKFVLQLSGISDIYDVFGKIVNTSQIVDMLPFERFDKVNSAVNDLKDMSKHLDHSECVKSYKNSRDFVGNFPESGKINGHCKWPLYHGDLSDLNTHKKFQRVEIKNSFEKKSFETRLAKKAGELELTKDVDKIVKTELQSLVNRLHDDLSSDIFDEKTEETIELTRNVCDLKSMAENIDEKGAIIFGTISADLFVDSAKKITNTISDIPDNILKQNYRDFLLVLEKHIKDNKTKSYDSKELIKQFLDSGLKLYKGIEITLQSICAAAIKISVESDVESLVSRYENHFTVDRQLDEEKADDEMLISENGPALQNADRTLKNAMDKFWGGGQWHFIATKSQFFKSKVLDRMRKQPSRLSFMDV